MVSFWLQEQLVVVNLLRYILFWRSLMLRELIWLRLKTLLRWILRGLIRYRLIVKLGLTLLLFLGVFLERTLMLLWLVRLGIVRLLRLRLGLLLRDTLFCLHCILIILLILLKGSLIWMLKGIFWQVPLRELFPRSLLENFVISVKRLEKLMIMKRSFLEMFWAKM